MTEVAAGSLPLGAVGSQLLGVTCLERLSGPQARAAHALTCTVVRAVPTHIQIAAVQMEAGGMRTR